MKNNTNKQQATRRNFFRKSLATATRGGIAAAALTGLIVLKRSRHAPEGAREALGMLRPPGALDEVEFMAACIRCTRCADACDTHCIEFFGPDAGQLHATPYIIPEQCACNMCLECGPACPVCAILPLERKEDIHMGVAYVDERLCVSTNQTGVCGACYTVCPLREKAITQGIRNAPTIHPEFCTGCGLCEEFCIVDERNGLRAIQIKTSRSWTEETAA